jgi:hypothetical protein
MEKAITKRKKGGRPEKTVKKEVRACARFSKIEYFVIREKASKAGIKISEYIRQAAIHADIKTRLSKEEREFARQLVGMANNINQLAKTCHQEGMLRTMVYFETYCKRLDEILLKLKP